MKFPSLAFALATIVSAFVSQPAHAQLPGPGGGLPSLVNYFPITKVIQGNQPVSEAYELEVFSPDNLSVGTPVVVALELSILSKPAGVSDVEALGFVELSTTSLTFTGPSERRSLVISVNVPVGAAAGDFAYKIQPTGWPVTANGITDNGATINAVVAPPQTTDTSPPTVVLLTPADGSQFTYFPASGVPVSIPVSFSATVGTGGDPITRLSARLNGVEFPTTATGLNTLSATGTGTLTLTAAGNYTVDVLAANDRGQSVAAADLTVVVSAPPPVITSSAPTAGASFSFNLGGAGASIPVSFAATSPFGNVTALAATLNGNPITGLNFSGVGAATTATGSGLLTITTPGNYTLRLTAANEFGAATPVDVPFTVVGLTPTPTVTIDTPADGATFTRNVGDPATPVNVTFHAATSFGTLTALSATLDGQPVAATVSGLNTAALTGAAALSFATGGTHTFVVTVSNGSAQATATTHFTITENQPTVCQNLEWLPPISLNKTIEGGSVMPIKFTLTCEGTFVRDTTTIIAIYEIFANGSSSTPVLYPFGTGSPNPPDYAITGQMYHLNFPTEKGAHHYRIEVYHPHTANPATLQLLGSKDLFTKGGDVKEDDHGQAGGGSSGGMKDDDDDDDHHSDGKDDDKKDDKKDGDKDSDKSKDKKDDDKKSGSKDDDKSKSGEKDSKKSGDDKSKDSDSKDKKSDSDKKDDKKKDEKGKEGGKG